MRHPSWFCQAVLVAVAALVFAAPVRAATGCGAGTYLSGSSCVACPSGTYKTKNGDDLAGCQACPAGAYCTNPADSPVSCPAGSASLGSSTSCDACATGYYADSTASVTCSVCPAGSQCADASASPSACAAGTYSDSGAVACTACPAGSYSTSAGTPSACTLCPAGYECADPSASPSLCDEGYYSENGAATGCSACPYGSRSSSDRLRCDPCPAGYSCADPTDPAVACAAGTYSEEGSDPPTLCKACPAGSYCADPAQTPQFCSAGTYSEAGADSCTDCPAGSSCADPSSPPVACSGGFYAPAGSTTCTACPAGFYCASTAVAAPTACASGEYSLGTATSCTACPSGYACPLRDSAPSQCPAGTYAAAGDATCSICPAGYFCATAGMAAPTVCADGSTSSAGSAACSDCPAGFSCSGGATEPCGLGTYTVAGQSSCVTCPAGFFCPASDADAVVPCALGSYSLAGASACTACPAGSACPDTDTDATITACAAGSYSLAGEHECTACPAGWNCPALDGSGNHRCSPGTYSLGSVSTGCTVCPAGSACPDAFTDASIVTCVAGTFADAGSILCTHCPAGYECPSTSDSGAMSACASGYYSIGNQTACDACPAGYNCPSHVSNQKELCAPGHYSPEATAACVECPAGSFCTDPTAMPTLCEVGTYSLAGAANCTDCPAGYACTSTGVSAPTQCLAGFYSTAGSTVGCQLCTDGYACVSGSTSSSPRGSECPEGFYCNSDNPGAPQPCPDGYYGYREGGTAVADACKDCDASYYCPEGSTRTTRLLCPAGYYCPGRLAGQADSRYQEGWPTACQAGTYNLLTGQIDSTDCTPCEAGYYCPLGSSSLTVCPAGHYCPSSSPSPTDCPDGTFGGADRTGLSASGQCFNCTTGHYCTGDGDPDPTECPRGTYQPYVAMSRQANCLPCPAGWACPSTGMSLITTRCSPGHWCDEGTVNPDDNPCPAGTYTDRVDAPSSDSCLPCPERESCRQGTGGSDYPEPCEPGYYCPGGSEYGNLYTTNLLDPALCTAGSVCPCPAGRFGSADNLADYTECTLCPEGRYCTGALTAPDAQCITGHFCPNGTASATEHPCPAGTYNPDIGLTEVAQCTECEVGKYCVGGQPAAANCPAGRYANVTGTESAAECPECPAGWFCAGTGNVDPEPCGVGYYSAGGATSCTICEAGHYCPSNSTTRAQHEDVFICPAGMYCPEGFDRAPDFLRDSCPAGQYCEAGVALPVDCPAGTNNPHLGGKSESGDCTPCPAGTYCEQGESSAEFTGLCAAGYYCPEGSSVAATTPCPAQFYRASEGARMLSDCALCLSGSYCPNQATVTPTECPAGKYCTTGLSTPVDCPTGTFSNATGVRREADCSPCRAGSFCETEGLVSPTGACAAGYFCLEGSDTATPGASGSLSTAVTPIGGLCPAGGFCPVGSSAPAACDPGTFSNVTGAADNSVCKPCDPGYYCQGTSNPEPSGECDPGYFCPGGASDPKQNSSMEGYYSPAGSAFPIECERGTFNNQQRQEECKLCLAGRYCPDIATILPLQCPVGFFCPEGTADPTPCPVGTFSTQRGSQNATQCAPCPAGSYCASEGANTTTGLCDPGFYCTGGSWLPNPGADGTERAFGGLCPAGHYCPQETKFATQHPCGNGTYLPTEGNDVVGDCLLCEPGYYCPSPGLSAPDPTGCAPGYYCQEGADTARPTPDGPTGGICPVGTFCNGTNARPVNCSAGTYQDTTGASECKQCPAGSFCDGSTPGAPQPCEQGHYCPAGTGVTQPRCPRGTYSAQHSLEQASDCTPCDAGSHCSHAGLTAVEGPCAAGYYCPPGAMNPYGLLLNTTLLLNELHNGTGLSADDPPCLPGNLTCPAGRFCLEGSSEPTLCSAGTFSTSTGNTGAADCQPCSPGQYCESPGLVAPSGPCRGGFYCAAGAKVNAPRTGLSPVLVQAGVWAYSGGEGAFVSDSDGDGYINVTVGGDICPAGSFCVDGSASPAPCPGGSYGPAEGESSPNCTLCPGGYSCPAGSTEFASRPCPGGYFCPAGTSSYSDHPCPAGTFSNATVQATSSCNACPAGFYCEGEANTAPTGPCSAGYYCSSGAASATPIDGVTGGQCQPGEFCPEQTSVPQLCPGGSYCSSTSGSIDGSCDAGYYCVGGSFTPTPRNETTSLGDSIGDICPPGHYCPGGSSTFTPCDPGTSSEAEGLAAQGQCEDCRAGFYCAESGVVTPDTPCSAGFFCPSGTVTPGSAPSAECPVGTRCPEGSAGPDPCEPGSYQGATQQAECDPCPAGYYCPEVNGTVTPLECPTGHVCPANTSAAFAFPCPAGTYRELPGGSDLDLDCDPCPAGSFCGTEGLSAPTGSCAAGFYCLGGSAVAAPTEGFDSGYTCSLTLGCGNASAYPLSPGDAVGDAQCAGAAGSVGPAQSCAAGGPDVFWLGILDGNGSSTNATLPSTGDICPRGHFCQAGSMFPQVCPAGKFNSEFGATALEDCEDCSGGFFCPNASTVFPTQQCPAGMYCEPGTVSPTLDCPVGRHCPAGSSAPQPCEPGSYSPATAAASCLVCPAGWVCDSFNVSRPDPCPVGHYCPEGTGADAGSQPQPCPAGSFNGRLRASALGNCSACPEGLVCDGDGLAAPSGNCSAGYYCVGGADTPVPTAVVDGQGGGLCPPGHYCPSGSAQPTTCDAGRYNNGTGAVSVDACRLCLAGFVCPASGTDHPTTPCPAGYYCTPGRQAADEACPPGHFCPGGDPLPRPCGPGTFTNETMQTECAVCPAGYSCGHWAVTDPVPCEAGHFCPAGSTNTTARGCPAGTYSAAVALPSAAECLPCPPGLYCGREGLTTPTGLCGPGHYCLSSASEPRPADGVTGDTCAAGHICTYGSDTPTPQHPLGSQLSTSDALLPYYDEAFGVGALLTASATGAEAILLGQALGNASCPSIAALTSLAGGSLLPPRGYVCPLGTHCPAGALSPIGCPPGTYADSYGQAVCDDCPPGQLCLGNTTTPVDCPEGYLCPGATGVPEPCAPGTYGARSGLYDQEECSFCPPGVYCTGGFVAGQSFGGFVCRGNCSTPTPDFGSVEEAAGWGYPCPEGFFCPNGSWAEQPCSNGLVGTELYMPSEAVACRPCPAGRVCYDGQPATDPCPRGYFCPGAGAIYPCNATTWNPVLASTSAEACVLCDAGHYCTDIGIGNQTRFPCPAGSFCYEGANETLPCPAGTYRDERGAAAAEECWSCPAGFFCGAGSVSPTVCPTGTFCLEGATVATPCPAGTYCPLEGEQAATPCPAGFACPRNQTVTPELCPPGTYCPAGSVEPTFCSAGSVAANLTNDTLLRTSAAEACELCPAGTYSDGLQGGTACLACAPGYVCLGGTSSAAPVKVESDGGFPCPPGFWCTPGAASTADVHACPAGSFNAVSRQYDLSACAPCGNNSYNHLTGQAACRPCSSSSLSLGTGSTACQCRGLFRHFQPDDGMCICQPTYEFVDANGDVFSDQDGEEDCQPKSFDYCLEGEVRLSSGECAALNCNDLDVCSSGMGTFDATAGVCVCEGLTPAEVLCDAECQAAQPQVAGSAASREGVMTVTDPVSGAAVSISTADIPGFAGRVLCEPESSAACADPSNEDCCAVRGMTVDPSGFAGSYGSALDGVDVAGLAGGSGRRLSRVRHARRAAAARAAEQERQERLHARRLGSAAAPAGDEEPVQGVPPLVFGPGGFEEMSAEEYRWLRAGWAAEQAELDELREEQTALRTLLNGHRHTRSRPWQDRYAAAASNALNSSLSWLPGREGAGEQAAAAGPTGHSHWLARLLRLAGRAVWAQSPAGSGEGEDAGAGSSVAARRGSLVPHRRERRHRRLHPIAAAAAAARSRSLATDSSTTIDRPLVCLKEYDSLLFKLPAGGGAYPVYVKDSFLNTNPDFDYGEFRRLAELALSGTDLTMFAFTFRDNGTYVFASSADASQQTIVVVVADGQACPGEGSGAFTTMSEENLVALGVVEQSRPLLGPNWPLLAAIMGGLLVMLLLVIGGLLYLRLLGWGALATGDGRGLITTDGEGCMPRRGGRRRRGQSKGDKPSRNCAGGGAGDADAERRLRRKLGQTGAGSDDDSGSEVDEDEMRDLFQSDDLDLADLLELLRRHQRAVAAGFDGQAEKAQQLLDELKAQAQRIRDLLAKVALGGGSSGGGGGGAEGVTSEQAAAAARRAALLRQIESELAARALFDRAAARREGDIMARLRELSAELGPDPSATSQIVLQQLQLEADKLALRSQGAAIPDEPAEAAAAVAAAGGVASVPVAARLQGLRSTTPADSSKCDAIRTGLSDIRSLVGAHAESVALERERRAQGTQVWQAAAAAGVLDPQGDSALTRAVERLEASREPVDTGTGTLLELLLAFSAGAAELSGAVMEALTLYLRGLAAATEQQNPSLRGEVRSEADRDVRILYDELRRGLDALLGRLVPLVQRLAREREMARRAGEQAAGPLGDARAEAEAAAREGRVPPEAAVELKRRLEDLIAKVRAGQLQLGGGGGGGGMGGVGALGMFSGEDATFAGADEFVEDDEAGESDGESEGGGGGAGARLKRRVEEEAKEEAAKLEEKLEEERRRRAAEEEAKKEAARRERERQLEAAQLDEQTRQRLMDDYDADRQRLAGRVEEERRRQEEDLRRKLRERREARLQRRLRVAEARAAEELARRHREEEDALRRRQAEEREEERRRLEEDDEAERRERGLVGDDERGRDDLENAVRRLQDEFEDEQARLDLTRDQERRRQAADLERRLRDRRERRMRELRKAHNGEMAGAPSGAGGAGRRAGLLDEQLAAVEGLAGDLEQQANHDAEDAAKESQRVQEAARRAREAAFEAAEARKRELEGQLAGETGRRAAEAEAEARKAGASEMLRLKGGHEGQLDALRANGASEEELAALRAKHAAECAELAARIEEDARRAAGQAQAEEDAARAALGALDAQLELRKLRAKADEEAEQLRLVEELERAKQRDALERRLAARRERKRRAMRKAQEEEAARLHEQAEAAAAAGDEAGAKEAYEQLQAALGRHEGEAERLEAALGAEEQQEREEAEQQAEQQEEDLRRRIDQLHAQHKRNSSRRLAELEQERRRQRAARDERIAQRKAERERKRLARQQEELRAAAEASGEAAEQVRRIHEAENAAVARLAEGAAAAERAAAAAEDGITKGGLDSEAEARRLLAEHDQQQAAKAMAQLRARRQQEHRKQAALAERRAKRERAMLRRQQEAAAELEREAAMSKAAANAALASGDSVAAAVANARVEDAAACLSELQRAQAAEADRLEAELAAEEERELEELRQQQASKAAEDAEQAAADRGELEEEMERLHAERERHLSELLLAEASEQRRQQATLEKRLRDRRRKRMWQTRKKQAAAAASLAAKNDREGEDDAQIRDALEALEAREAAEADESGAQELHQSVVDQVRERMEAMRGAGDEGGGGVGGSLTRVDTAANLALREKEEEDQRELEERLEQQRKEAEAEARRDEEAAQRQAEEAEAAARHAIAAKKEELRERLKGVTTEQAEQLKAEFAEQAAAYESRVLSDKQRQQEALQRRLAKRAERRQRNLQRQQQQEAAEAQERKQRRREEEERRAVEFAEMKRTIEQSAPAEEPAAAPGAGAAAAAGAGSQPSPASAAPAKTSTLRGDIVETILIDRHGEEEAELMARQYRERSTKLQEALAELFEAKHAEQSELLAESKELGRSDEDTEKLLQQLQADYEQKQSDVTEALTEQLEARHERELLDLRARQTAEMGKAMAALAPEEVVRRREAEQASAAAQQLLALRKKQSLQEAERVAALRQQHEEQEAELRRQRQEEMARIEAEHQASLEQSRRRAEEKLEERRQRLAQESAQQAQEIEARTAAMDDEERERIMAEFDAHQAELQARLEQERLAQAEKLESRLAARRDRKRQRMLKKQQEEEAQRALAARDAERRARRRSSAMPEAGASVVGTPQRGATRISKASVASRLLPAPAQSRFTSAPTPARSVLNSIASAAALHRHQTDVTESARPPHAAAAGPRQEQRSRTSRRLVKQIEDAVAGIIQRLEGLPGLRPDAGALVRAGSTGPGAATAAAAAADRTDIVPAAPAFEDELASRVEPGAAFAAASAHDLNPAERLRFEMARRLVRSLVQESRSLKAVDLHIADSIPASPEATGNAFAGLWYQPPDSRRLYIHRRALHNSSDIGVLLAHTLAHISIGAMGDDAAPAFRQEFHRMLRLYSQLMFREVVHNACVRAEAESNGTGSSTAGQRMQTAVGQVAPELGPDPVSARQLGRLLHMGLVTTVLDASRAAQEKQAAEARGAAKFASVAARAGGAAAAGSASEASTAQAGGRPKNLQIRRAFQRKVWSVVSRAKAVSRQHQVDVVKLIHKLELQENSGDTSPRAGDGGAAGRGSRHDGDDGGFAAGSVAHQLQGLTFKTCGKVQAYLEQLEQDVLAGGAAGSGAGAAEEDEDVDDDVEIDALAQTMPASALAEARRQALAAAAAAGAASGGEEAAGEDDVEAQRSKYQRKVAELEVAIDKVNEKLSRTLGEEPEAVARVEELMADKDAMEVRLDLVRRCEAEEERRQAALAAGEPYEPEDEEAAATDTSTLPSSDQVDARLGSILNELERAVARAQKLHGRQEKCKSQREQLGARLARARQRLSELGPAADEESASGDEEE